MREIRQSGSEGGAARNCAVPTPIISPGLPSLGGYPGSEPPAANLEKVESDWEKIVVTVWNVRRQGGNPFRVDGWWFTFPG